MTRPDNTEPSAKALDPELWIEACRIYGFVTGVDPVELTEHQEEIITRAYAALDRFRAAGVREERARAALLADSEAAASKRFFDGCREGAERRTYGAVILAAKRLAAQIRSGESHDR